MQSACLKGATKRHCGSELALILQDDSRRIAGRVDFGMRANVGLVGPTTDIARMAVRHGGRVSIVHVSCAVSPLETLELHAPPKMLGGPRGSRSRR